MEGKKKKKGEGKLRNTETQPDTKEIECEREKINKGDETIISQRHPSSTHHSKNALGFEQLARFPPLPPSPSPSRTPGYLNRKNSACLANKL